MSSEVAGKTLTTDYVNVIDGTLTIGVYDPSEGNGWFVMDNFKLYYYGKDLEALENTLQAKITEAQNVVQTNLNTVFKSQLSQEIAAAQADLSDENRTVKSLETATSELNEIIVLTTNPIHADLVDLLASCNSYAANSTPNDNTYLTVFNKAITDATDAREDAATIEALNTAYTDLEAARQEYVLKAYPTNDVTFDMTFKIVNPNFETNSDGWNIQNGKRLGGTGYDEIAGIVEIASWGSESWNASISQIVSLPDGQYKVKAAAMASTPNTELTLTANENTAKLNCIGDKGGNIAADGSVVEMGAGVAGWQYLEVECLVENGKLNIVANSSATAVHCWANIDNFTLTLIRDLTPEEKFNAAKKQLYATIQSVNSLNTTKNVGDGLFEIPESAVTTLQNAVVEATGVYNNNAATTANLLEADEDLLAAIEAYKNAELNAPNADAYFYLNVATEGHARKGYPIEASLGDTHNSNKTGYGFAAKNDSYNYRPKLFTFTKVEGEGTNLYHISVFVNNEKVYLTYGALNDSQAGHKTQQIQGNKDVTKAGVFKIEASPAVEGAFRIFNTIHKDYLDVQAGGSVYTDLGQKFEDFSLGDASTVTTTINIAADVKLATCVLLFDATLPTGLKAYTTESLENGYLNLVEATELKAYTPYILYAENGCTDVKLSGEVDLNEYALKVTDANGLLAGAVETQTITEGYALQNQADKHGVAFYAVDTENSQKVTIPAGKCWLDVKKESTPAATTRSIILRFPGDETTGIEGLEIPVQIENGEIYTIDGKRVETMQSGQIYIVGGKKVIKK